MSIKHKLAALILLAAGATACTQYTAIATAPENKVFVTKTTSYIVWTTNKMLLCDYAANVAKNCSEVSEQ
jgi:hypothetical protein